jgi:RES domain-containing protein
LPDGTGIKWAETGQRALLPIDWGTEWARSGASLLAEVPSVVVPEESNILINPAYAGAARLKVSKLRKWRYDLRLSG